MPLPGIGGAGAERIVRIQDLGIDDLFELRESTVGAPRDRERGGEFWLTIGGPQGIRGGLDPEVEILVEVRGPTRATLST